MRIISGKYGRRRFQVPRNFNARPTTDQAKENLFNMLSHRIDLEGIRALDLFAGTGSISAELISRGCKLVRAIEKRREHAQFIRQVAKELGEEKNILVSQDDVFSFLRNAGESEAFQLIFADPPYALSNLAQLPHSILETKLLASNGLLIVEHPKEINFAEHPLLIDHRVYSAVNFSFFAQHDWDELGELFASSDF